MTRKPGRFARTTRRRACGAAPRLVSLDDIRFEGIEPDGMAERLGTTVLCQLGQGDDGVAHLLEDGRVMKVTSSSTEAAVSAVFARSGHRGLPRVDGVWRTVGAAVFPDGTRREYSRYVIVREEAADVFDDFDDDDDAERCREWRAAVHMLGEGWNDDWQLVLDAVGSTDGRRLIPVYSALLWARDKLGIEIRDIRPSAIGVADDGRVVIRDFGRAIVPDEYMAVVARGEIPDLPEAPEPSPSP
jgi:hypothetical protein